jgi:glycosyltransferase involved in cell wall biosynthesis
MTVATLDTWDLEAKPARRSHALEAGRPPLLVLSDDWGRHPTSCQHLVRALLPRYRVWWVNLVGMRRPRLDLLTWRRGLDKLRDWLLPHSAPTPLPQGLTVLSPVIWPSFRSRLDRWLNRQLLGRRLARLARALPAPPVVMSTQPTMAALVGSFPAERWVYYCVDDFAHWPGLDQVTLRELENQLYDKADHIIAASSVLARKARQRGRDPKILTHGVDVRWWRRREPTTHLPCLDKLERPLVVFWGLIDRRLDAAFLQQLGRDLQRGTVVLVGPESKPADGREHTPRLVRLPAIPFNHLPTLARAADALIMPYADQPLTCAMQPLKLKEYLATGKPVIARTLPAVDSWTDCLDAVATPAEFSRAVRLRLATGLPEEQRQARARLHYESWTAKAAEFEALALNDGCW